MHTCQNCPTVGHSFLEFLRYYAHDFDASKMFVDRGQRIFVLSAECLKVADLVVLDPFRIGINAARNLTRFADIKALFNMTHEHLMGLIKKYESGEEITEIMESVYKTQLV